MGQLLAAYFDSNHLHVALKNDSTWVSIRMLLFCGSDVNKRDHYGRTPLHIAISHKNSSDIVRLLAKKGTDIDAADYNGLTPLHVALQENSPLHIIQHLLDCGADVNLKDIENNSALHMAVIHHCQDTYEILNKLIKSGDDINSRNEFGETVLHLCFKHELHFSVIKFLLDNGSDPTFPNQWGGNCLHYCLLYGKASPHILNNINLLLECKSVDINHPDQAGDTALHIAARNDLSKDVVSLLCQKGADAEIQNSLGCTPLHYVQSSTIMDVLFKRRELVNIQDRRCCTFLHHLFKGKEVLPSLLKKALAYDCDPNLQDHLGKTVLHAVLHGFRHSENLFLNTKYLLKYIRDIDIQDINGETVLHIALRRNVPSDVLHLLIKSGADPDIRNKHGISPLQEFHAQNSIDYSKLILVIEKSIDFNVKDKNTGSTFLHRILLDLSTGNNSSTEVHKKVETLEKLLKIGLDPNAIVEREHDLLTPLVVGFQWVSKFPEEASLSAIQLLYQHGAYPHMIVNQQKQTAIEHLVNLHPAKELLSLRVRASAIRECIFLSLRAGLNMHKIGPHFILSVMKTFVLLEDWEALRRLFKYGVTINHLHANENDKKLLLQILLSSSDYSDIYPLTLFESSANVLRTHLWPNCYKGLDKLCYKNNGIQQPLPDILKEQILSSADLCKIKTKDRNSFKFNNSNIKHFMNFDNNISTVW